jgi:hypothetical protein
MNALNELDILYHNTCAKEGLVLIEDNELSNSRNLAFVQTLNTLQRTQLIGLVSAITVAFNSSINTIAVDLETLFGTPKSIGADGKPQFNLSTLDMRNLDALQESHGPLTEKLPLWSDRLRRSVDRIKILHETASSTLRYNQSIGSQLKAAKIASNKRYDVANELTSQVERRKALITDFIDDTATNRQDTIDFMKSLAVTSTNDLVMGAYYAGIQFKDVYADVIFAEYTKSHADIFKQYNVISIGQANMQTVQKRLASYLAESSQRLVALELNEFDKAGANSDDRAKSILQWLGIRLRALRWHTRQSTAYNEMQAQNALINAIGTPEGLLAGLYDAVIGTTVLYIGRKAIQRVNKSVSYTLPKWHGQNDLPTGALRSELVAYFGLIRTSYDLSVFFNQVGFYRQREVNPAANAALSNGSLQLCCATILLVLLCDVQIKVREHEIVSRREVTQMRQFIEALRVALEANSDSALNVAAQQSASYGDAEYSLLVSLKEYLTLFETFARDEVDDIASLPF